jgi:xanthosine utilization system XapX-like protein
MNDIWIALIGILGVTVGAGLNELLRRKARLEAYTVHVFDKRLEKYEELMGLVQGAYEVATDVMENPQYSSEQRHDLISGAILRIAQFTDDNELYIDPELAPHCVAAFMGAEDIHDVEHPQKRKERQREVLQNYTSAKRMIREDSGLAQIDKLFKTMTRPRISSPIIERIRYLRAHPEMVHALREEDDEASSDQEIHTSQ